ncbi:MAG TPA: hypothetical protein VIS07_04180 [Candidatus Binatia bacterium]
MTADAAPSREPEATRGARGVGLSSAVWSFLVYTALFAVFAAPWLLNAHRGAPQGYIGNAADERLVVWILAWVAHALATDPTSVFDANINHPAPAQLTGSEHLASAQILFAPLYALTDNALLAANLTVFLTYPLAALAMQRLLLALGCGFSVASVVGLVFALGPYRLPGHLHLLQYTNLFLPWVALAVTRLRGAPDARHALLLALALGAAALSSYYMAVFAAVVALLWFSFEVARPGERRARFVVLAVVTAAAVALVVVLVSLPYLARAEAEVADGIAPYNRTRELMLGTFASRAIQSSGRLALVLAGVGLVGLLVRDVAARTCALRGLVLTVLAQATAVGAYLTLDGVAIPTPFALIAASPLKFFRYPFRFAVVVGFGVALLCAALLQAIAARLGRRVGRLAALALGVVVLATGAVRLSGTGIAEFSGQTDPIYDEVDRITRIRGRGPLLELPIVDPLADARGGVLGTEVESMLGSTRHWLPLVAGFTGYPSSHRKLVLRQAQDLPDENALQNLVDMTHVSWVLLQPKERWPERMRAQRRQILKSPSFERVKVADGWALLRVKTKPRHGKWYRALAAGERPGQTLLGTPLAPISEEAAVARVTGDVPSPVFAGRAIPARLEVANRGLAAWPVSAPRGDDRGTHLVGLVSEWWPAGGDRKGVPVATRAYALPLDVEPGATVKVARWLRAPETPGEYDLTVRVRQWGGARFTAPGNEPLTRRVRVDRAPPDADQKTEAKAAKAKGVSKLRRARQARRGASTK